MDTPTALSRPLSAASAATTPVPPKAKSKRARKRAARKARSTAQKEQHAADLREKRQQVEYLEAVIAQQQEEMARQNEYIVRQRNAVRLLVDCLLRTAAYHGPYDRLVIARRYHPFRRLP